ncbi:hypothetical protein AB0F52_08920 [Amycolatopsis sp. NPDC024027]|uniref:hypothetical protein n=1 Tax=Amycolatopsis sp. NPDC024027 TaxID=3154327 RepID=UPI0034057D4D
MRSTSVSSPPRFAADVLENRGRTSTRGGVLKAEAAVRYAEVLAGSGVHAVGDVTTLLPDLTRLDVVESRLRAVPGNGGHDVRLGYLWMLAGTDEHVKPDRKVLRWLERTSATRSTSRPRSGCSPTPPSSWAARPGNSTTRSGRPPDRRISAA